MGKVSTAGERQPPQCISGSRRNVVCVISKRPGIIAHIEKSVLIWEGYVINGYMGYADILWQGCRYVSDFVREYRRFYGV